MESACHSCKKGPPEVTLKRCTGCSETQYCSRECQKKDWKSHKKTCGKPQDSTATPEASTSDASARPTHDFPFSRLDQGIWLHDRPETETYQLLIDAYRLLVEDTYVAYGERMEGSLYATGNHGLVGFRKFLKKAATVPGLLPPWWNDEKKRACEQLGIDRLQWSHLQCPAHESDIIDRYKDHLFPTKLRLLSDAVYGSHSTDSEWMHLRELMRLIEEGRMGFGMDVAHTVVTLVTTGGGPF